jgi:DNA-directed RNA polymerase subunit RPC12/RpoP
MGHVTSNYRDGWFAIEHCLNCGKEGDELEGSACKPLAVDCPICGHNIFAKEICKNCQELANLLDRSLTSKTIGTKSYPLGFT